jgi:hypothetical protein
MACVGGAPQGEAQVQSLRNEVALLRAQQAQVRANVALAPDLPCGAWPY